jgi:hypothetical protein
MHVGDNRTCFNVHMRQGVQCRRLEVFRQLAVAGKGWLEREVHATLPLSSEHLPASRADRLQVPADKADSYAL